MVISAIMEPDWLRSKNNTLARGPELSAEPDFGYLNRPWHFIAKRRSFFSRASERVIAQTSGFFRAPHRDRPPPRHRGPVFSLARYNRRMCNDEQVDRLGNLAMTASRQWISAVIGNGTLQTNHDSFGVLARSAFKRPKIVVVVAK